VQVLIFPGRFSFFSLRLALGTAEVSGRFSSPDCSLAICAWCWAVPVHLDFLCRFPSGCPRAQCSSRRTHFSLLLECPLWFLFTGHSVCSRSLAVARSSRRFSSQGEVARLVLAVLARCACQVLLIFAPGLYFFAHVHWFSLSLLADLV
jgi:hypothetical protein